jgi:hypothetical protein
LKLASVFTLVFLCCLASVCASLLYDGWFSTGDSVFLNETLYTVYIGNMADDVLLRHGNDGVIIEDGSCQSFEGYDICVNNTRYNNGTYETHMRIYEFYPVISITRSNTSISGLPGDKKTFTLTFNNSGNTFADLDFTEVYPQGITVFTWHPCTTDGSTLYYKLRVGPDKEDECSAQLIFDYAVSSTVGGVARYNDQTALAPSFVVNVSDPLQAFARLNRSYIDLAKGNNGTELSYTLRNYDNKPIPVNLSVLTVPAYDIGNPYPFVRTKPNTYVYDVIVPAKTNKSFDMDIYDDHMLNVSFYLYGHYAYQDRLFPIEFPYLSLRFDDSNKTVPVNRSITFIPHNQVIKFFLNSSNGTSLQPFQSTALYIRLNNSVTDADVTDIRFEIKRDGTLIDRIYIPYLGPLESQPVPPVFIEGGLYDGAKEIKISLKGGAYVNNTYVNISQEKIITIPKSDVVTIKSELPENMYEAQRLNKKVGLDTSFEGPVQVHIKDTYSAPVQIIGSNEVVVRVEGNINGLLDYVVYVPRELNLTELIVNTTVDFLDSEGSIQLSKTDKAKVLQTPINVTISTSLDAARQGDMTYATLTITNDNNYTLSNFTLGTDIQRTLDVANKSIYIGTLHPYNTRTVRLPFRFTTTNKTFHWRNVFGDFTFYDRTYRQYMEKKEVTMSASTQNHGLRYNASSSFDEYNRLAQVNVTIYNTDNFKHYLRLPYVDAVTISYEDMLLPLDINESYTIYYTTDNYDKTVWKGITYDYFDQLFYSGFVLPDLNITPLVEQTVEETEIEVETETPEKKNTPNKKDDSAVVVGTEENSPFSVGLLMIISASGILLGVLFLFVFMHKKKPSRPH